MLLLRLELWVTGNSIKLCGYYFLDLVRERAQSILDKHRTNIAVAFISLVDAMGIIALNVEVMKMLRVLRTATGTANALECPFGSTLLAI